VFATTGAEYTALARRAAQTVRAVLPDIPIEMFTDQTGDLPEADVTFPLPDSHHRPKFHALANSRFDRAIYLDADIHAMAPFADLFDLLDKFDLAAAHDQYRNAGWPLAIWRTALPPSFPQVNSGVLAARLTAPVRAFLREVDETLRAENAERDQPILREMLWHSDLALGILPPEYNCFNFFALEAQNHLQPGPRILHNSQFHRAFTRDGSHTTGPEHVLGPALYRHALRLIAADRTLGATGTTKVRRFSDQGILGDLRRRSWRLGKRGRQLLDRLRRK